LSDQEKQKIINQVKETCLNINFGKDKNFSFIDMEKLSSMQALSMTEQHLISYEMAVRPKNRAVLLSEDKTVSIMINEEDHIRIQVFSDNFDIHNLYNQAKKIDAVLDERLKYAFDPQLGFLTECLTNLGTGMRASVLLHLPAIDRNGLIPNISNTLSKIGLTIRGSFGEGSKVKGSFYQISNQITLGITENTALNNLKSIVTQIINQERVFRKTLIKNDINFEDSIMRAYGILKYTKVISYEEFIDLASLVRIGIAEKLITEINLKTIDYLINNLGVGTISYQNHLEQEPVKRDKLRASIINKSLQHK
jgi:protein arginine kinase